MYTHNIFVSQLQLLQYISIYRIQVVLVQYKSDSIQLRP